MEATSGCDWTSRYDGTDFSGWAAQPARRTVAGVLIAEAWTGCSAPTRSTGLTVAGRTDAGVHATGQVCHVDVPDDRSGSRCPTSLLRRLAGLLPPDVRVPRRDRGAGRVRRPVLGDCSGATSTGSPTPPCGAEPLRRHDTLAWPRPLDLDRAQRRRRGPARRARLRGVLQAQGARHHDPGR